jgi:hypothetical protein
MRQLVGVLDRPAPSLTTVVLPEDRNKFRNPFRPEECEKDGRMRQLVGVLDRRAPSLTTVVLPEDRNKFRHPFRPEECKKQATYDCLRRVVSMEDSDVEKTG